MNRDKPDNITHSLQALSVFRGIYKRVAVQLDVDPSYVSRVARGERNAPFVSDALRKEIQRVLGKAGLHNGDGKAALHNGDGNNHDHSNGTLAALLDGNHSNGHRPGLHSKDGHAKDGHTRDGQLFAADGHHSSSRGKQNSGKKPGAKKVAAASRKRKR
jgi:hypothetical protein